MKIKLPKLLSLAELEHRLSSVPGGSTRGHVGRILVGAFWRGDLEATNWTREQLRELGTCVHVAPNEVAELKSLPFESISKLGRRAYSPDFRKRCLDELLLNSAKAIQYLSGEQSLLPIGRPS